MPGTARGAADGPSEDAENGASGGWPTGAAWGASGDLDDGGGLFAPASGGSRGRGATRSRAGGRSRAAGRGRSAEQDRVGQSGDEFGREPGEGRGDGPPGDPVAAAKTICLRLLTARARTRHELAEALRTRGIPGEAAEQVLNRFTDVGLIDDEAFAEVFVRSRHRERGLGRSALRRELERKGVDRALAAQAVQAIDDDDERRRARELVLRKLDSAMFQGPEAARRRLLGMLARRGYGPSVALPVVNEALRGYIDPLEGEDSPE